MEQTFQILNTIYKPIYEYLQSILKVLKEATYDYKWGFYNNHYVKKNSQWHVEYYPIPIVTIKNICDIGIDINRIFVECKISRETVVEFNWNNLLDYKFEVYGVKDYLHDFYNASLDLDSILVRILESDEDEIAIEIEMDLLEDKVKVLDIIRKLEAMGTYIFESHL